MKGLTQYILENMTETPILEAQNDSFLFYKLIRDEHGVLHRYTPETKEAQLEILSWSREDYMDIIENTLNAFPETYNDKTISKLKEGLLRQCIDTWFTLDGEKRQVRNIPIAFNVSGGFKVRRAVADANDYKIAKGYFDISEENSNDNTHKRIKGFDKLKVYYGNGLMRFDDKGVSTKDQEDGTCHLWNRIVQDKNLISALRKYANKKGESTNVFRGDTWFDNLSDSWQRSCIVQCQGILKFLEETRKISNIQDYQAIRLDNDHKDAKSNFVGYKVTRKYEEYIKEYVKLAKDAFSNRFKEKYNNINIEGNFKVEKNTIDPSDIMLFHKNDWHQFFSKELNKTNTLEEIQSMFIQGYGQNCLFGISIKQCKYPPKIDEVNLKKIDKDNIEVSYEGKPIVTKDRKGINDSIWTLPDVKVTLNYKGSSVREYTFDIIARKSSGDKGLRICGKIKGAPSQLGDVPVNVWKTKLQLGKIGKQYNDLDELIAKLNQLYNNKDKNNEFDDLIKKFVQKILKIDPYVIPFIFIHSDKRNENS